MSDGGRQRFCRYTWHRRADGDAQRVLPYVVAVATETPALVNSSGNGTVSRIQRLPSYQTGRAGRRRRGQQTARPF
jgi:hypothetical protein